MVVQNMLMERKKQQKPTAKRKPKRNALHTPGAKRISVRIRSRLATRAEILAEWLSIDVSTVITIACREMIESSGRWKQETPQVPERDTPLSITLPPAIGEIIKAIADEEVSSVSDVVHRAIRTSLEKHGLFPHIDPDFATKQH